MPFWIKLKLLYNIDDDDDDDDVDDNNVNDDVLDYFGDPYLFIHNQQQQQFLCTYKTAIRFVR